MRPIRLGTRPRARRRFGQHFLAAGWARQVVTAIAPVPGDVFLEIGPGHGAVTLPLALSHAPILAVELDRDLAAALASKVPPNVTLISGDFLNMDILPLLHGLAPQGPPGAADSSEPRRYRVVGNLPYNVGTAMLERLLDIHRTRALFADATVMLQREVVDRLTARPGTKAYGALSVFVQLHTTPVRLLDLPPNAFSPPPKVRSSLVQLTFRPPVAKVIDQRAFDRLVTALFSQRRKTLANAIKRFDALGPYVLALSGLDGQRRPETLQVAEFARLAELFATLPRPDVL